MNDTSGKLRRLIGADFLSPKDFVRHAGLLVLLFVVAHVGGLREFTTIISGTMAEPRFGSDVCALLGLGYAALYFATVVLAPILLIAAGVLKLWEICGRNHQHAS
ncbi:MAG TPA: hypothetical protein VFV96_03930 [Verrucomicrobiae bacterium]|nr:hypothetical protein [Verrucomicrobiae bacterium]